MEEKTIILKGVFFLKIKKRDKAILTELYENVLKNFRNGQFIEELKKMYPEFSGYIESIIPYKVYKRIKCPCCGARLSEVDQPNCL